MEYYFWNLSALIPFSASLSFMRDMSRSSYCLLKAAKKLRIIGLVSEESIRREEESRERERNSRKRKAEEDNSRAGPAPSTSSAASSSCGNVQVGIVE